MPIIIYCGIIFFQSSFPSPEQVPRFPFADKIMHFVAYGILGVLICRAAFNLNGLRGRWMLVFLIGVLGSTLYGLSDEWHQSFVPGRSCDAADVMADFVGAIVGSGCYLKLKSNRPFF